MKNLIKKFENYSKSKKINENHIVSKMDLEGSSLRELIQEYVESLEELRDDEFNNMTISEIIDDLQTFLYSSSDY